MQIERSKVQLEGADIPIAFKRETGINAKETRADSRKHIIPSDSIDEATQNHSRGDFSSNQSYKQYTYRKYKKHIFALV
jgi:hypothetical protein